LFGPLDEATLLCFNTARATGVIGIVVWSWRTASTREVSGCLKRPSSVGHCRFSDVIW
jgi:hypothetical protein